MPQECPRRRSWRTLRGSRASRSGPGDYKFARVAWLHLTVPTGKDRFVNFMKAQSSVWPYHQEDQREFTHVCNLFRVVMNWPNPRKAEQLHFTPWFRTVGSACGCRRMILYVHLLFFTFSDGQSSNEPVSPLSHNHSPLHVLY